IVERIVISVRLRSAGNAHRALQATWDRAADHPSPLGGALGPALPAVVSNAAGLGMLVPWRADLSTVREQKRLLALIDPCEYCTTFESCDAASRLAPHHCTRFFTQASG